MFYGRGFRLIPFAFAIRLHGVVCSRRFSSSFHAAGRGSSFRHFAIRAIFACVAQASSATPGSPLHRLIRLMPAAGIIRLHGSLLPIQYATTLSIPLFPACAFNGQRRSGSIPAVQYIFDNQFIDKKKVSSFRRAIPALSPLLHSPPV